MNTLEFKNEFRLISADSFGCALEAWFECAGALNERGEYIPEEWVYRPGLLGGREEDSHWYEVFSNASTDQLHQIGNLLFRYCEYLTKKGKNY